MNMRTIASLILSMVLAVAALAWFTRPAVAQDAADDQTFDEKTAKQFTQFQEEMRKGLERGVDQIVKQYDLNEEQAQAVRKLAQERGQAFLKENSLTLFDLRQRMQSVGQFVREAGGDWQSLPEDIRKDLYDRAMPMLEAGQKQLLEFSNDVVKNVELSVAQRVKIAAQTKAMEVGFGVAKARARTMAGLPPEEGQADAAAEAGGPAGGNRPGRAGQPGGLGGAPPEAGGGAQRGIGMGARPLAGTAAWEAYVKDFVERYHLDEVQKLQANDILKKYKQRAEQVSASPASQPASQPAARSAEEFRTRLARLAEQRKPMADLFDQLKAELDKIPTPVQKQLGEKGNTAGNSGAAGGAGTASPGAAAGGAGKTDSAKPQE